MAENSNNKNLFTAATDALAALGANLLKLGGKQGDAAKAQDGNAEDDPAAPAAAKPTADLEGMLQRSDDVLATLRDVVRHAESTGENAKLAALLANAGLMSWEDAPQLAVNRLKRNGRFWLASARALEGPELACLWGIEAALNIGEDLEQAGAPSPLSINERIYSQLAGIVDLRPRPLPQGTAKLLMGSADPAGEWACRMGFANFVENVPAPFRMSLTGMRANVSEGIFEADAQVPGPDCFRFLAPANTDEDTAARIAAARAYTFRTTLLLARGAFGSSPALKLVNINCCDPARDADAGDAGNGAVVFSASLDRSALERLMSFARSIHGLDAGLPEDQHLSYRLQADGWLDRVAPMSLAANNQNGEKYQPPERWREVELDDSPAAPALAAACGVRKISDLALNEKAGRVAAWNKLLKDDGLSTFSTEKTVGALMSLRASTDDLTVAEACGRTASALVDGKLDVGMRQELALLFVDGGALNKAASKARSVLESEITPEALVETLGMLDEALEPITQTGLYLDDRDTVYRYFNSMAERVHYNRTADDGGRKVRLVPDEYYGAHSSAARILNMLDRHDEALAHAEELCRVAPVTPDAALGRVRCLEDQSRIFEAVDVLVDAIGYAATARDLAILFYRLAFMEWKLGRSDLAVPCYQRSIQLHPEMAEQSRAELADLLSEDQSLHPLQSNEVEPALKAAGLPVGDVERMRIEARDAAVACTDSGLFAVARPLTSVLIELNRDDALIDVYKSLGR